MRKNLKSGGWFKWLVLGSLYMFVLSSGGCSSSAGDMLFSGYWEGCFVDAPVYGLTYVATPSGATGVTDTNGVFRYKEGDTIVFKVGNITLPEIPADVIILPMSYYADANEDNYEDHLGVTQFVRFMLTAGGVTDDNIDEYFDEDECRILYIPAADQVFGGETHVWDINGNLFNTLSDRITVSAFNAVNHLRQTMDILRRAFPGDYSGTWEGSVSSQGYTERGSGTWSFDILDDLQIIGEARYGFDSTVIWGSVSVSGVTDDIEGEVGGLPFRWHGKINPVTGRVEGTWEVYAYGTGGGTFEGYKRD